MSGLFQNRTSSVEFDHGAVEGEFDGDRDWEFGGIFSEVSGLAERAVPQPDREAPKRRRHTMQTHWSQSSGAGDGAFSKINSIYFMKKRKY